MDVFECGGQRTTCGTQVLFSTMWVPGIEFRSSGLTAAVFYQLSCLSGPCIENSKDSLSSTSGSSFKSSGSIRFHSSKCLQKVWLFLPERAGGQDSWLSELADTQKYLHRTLGTLHHWVTRATPSIWCACLPSLTWVVQECQAKGYTKCLAFFQAMTGNILLSTVRCS